MKIALLSYGDIINYGDTFFPYLSYNEIKKRIPNAEIDLITNTSCVIGQHTTKEYSIEVIRTYDAVILVGGETIHDDDEHVWYPAYKKIGIIPKHNPSDIIFSWIKEDIKYKAWFSVGILPLSDKISDKIIDSINNLDYISVRGVLSKKMTEDGNLTYNNEINITPDLGWLFPRYIKNSYWQRQKIFNKYSLKIDANKPYIIVQFHDSTEPNIEEIARVLSKFKNEININIILLPFIKPWNDYATMKQVKDICGDSVILMPQDIDFLDIGAILCGAKFFIGASLHGATTLLAKSKPAGIVHTWCGTKYQDMLGMQFRNNCFENDWLNFERLLYRLLDESKHSDNSLKYYSKFMSKKLDVAFDNLCNDIKNNVIL